MNTYNKHFNDAWEYLEKYHDPKLAPTYGKAKYGKAIFEGFPNMHTLDMSFKPRIEKQDWTYYIDAITTVVLVGQRENFLHLHVNGKGQNVYWTVDKT